MKIWNMGFGVAAAVLLVTGSQAYAQEEAVGRPEGPWFFSTRLGGQFSDNRDGLENNKESNLDLFIEPRADYRLRDGDRTMLNLAVLPMLKWHSNPREEADGAPQNDTELFGTAAVELRHQLSPRVGIAISDALTYNDDPEIKNGANVRRSDNHVYNLLGAAIDAGLTETVYAGLDGQYALKRYSDSVVAADEDEDIYSGDAYLKVKTGAGYTLKGLLSASDFNNDSTTRSRGSQVIGAGVGVERVFSPDLTGKIKAGYQHGEYDDETVDSIDTPNGAAELTLRAASSTRFRVGGSYGLYAPYVRPYSIQKLTALNAAVDHDVLPNRLTVTLSGQYGSGKYEKEGEDLAGGNDDMYLVGVSANYRINRTFSLQGGYSYENWDSDVRESFGRNLVDFCVKAEM